MKRFRLCLRYFDGEGAGVASGSPAGEGVASAEATADSTQERPSFKDLIKGDYKQEADEYIQGIVRSRVKDSKADKAMIKSQNDILSIVAAKYGMDTSDLEALKSKVSEDDAYYEDRAMEEGLTVDQYKRIAQAEAKNKAYEEQMHQAQVEQQLQAQVAQWTDQAEQVKQSFPDFELQTELQNPTFQRLLQSGVDMQSAYVAIHNAEILQGAMQYTAQEVRKATANDIAARGTRPRENGASNRASANVRTDVSKLTRADREALARRAMSGEIVTLG